MPAVAYSRFAAEVEEIYASRAPATLAKMRQVLREIGEVPGVAKTSDLRPVVLARWVNAHPARTVATAESLLGSFRAAVSIGMASGYLATSPFAVPVVIPDPAEGPAGEKVRHYSVSEVEAMIALAGDEARASDAWKAHRAEALIATYAYAALRKREALFLRWEDVDFGRHVLRIRPNAPVGHRLKTRASAAPVPMAPALEEVLRRWVARCCSPWVFPGTRRLNPWTGGAPGHKPLCVVKALGRRAGVPGVTILGFRHSFATHAPRWGLSREMVRAILRHTSERTQDHYVHADVDDLVDAARRVGYRAALRTECA
jgi:integrase